MYIGTLMMAKGTTTYYSPWMQRQAENAWFTYQVIQNLLTGAGFSVKVYHKNTEDRGDLGTVVSGATFSEVVSGTGYYQANCQGLKELVRFEYTLVPGAGTTESIVARLLAAMWYDKIA